MRPGFDAVYREEPEVEVVYQGAGADGDDDAHRDHEGGDDAVTILFGWERVCVEVVEGEERDTVKMGGGNCE